MKAAVLAEEKQTESPSFWDDPKNAKKVLTEIKTKKTWTTAFEQVSTSLDDLALMWELFEANEITEEELLAQLAVSTKVVEELEFKNMLRNESDRFDAVISINSGVEQKYQKFPPIIPSLIANFSSIWKSGTAIGTLIIFLPYSSTIHSYPSPQCPTMSIIPIYSSLPVAE